MTESSNEKNSVANSRWWESYLVRYFSGFLVGSICVIAFVMQIAFITGGDLEIKKTIFSIMKKDGPLTAILVASGLLGLLYSYLVSAPITVIHYGRGVRIFWDGQSRYFWLAWVFVIGITAAGFNYDAVPRVVLILFIIILLIGLYFLDKRLVNFKKIIFSVLFWTFILFLIVGLALASLPSLSIWQQHLLVFSLPAAWIGVSQYITLFKILLNEKKIHEFYCGLTKARREPGALDIRDTYSHLREHSNSTFIVIVEVCFSCLVALVISLVVRPKQEFGEFISGDAVILMGWVLSIFMIWSVPNLFMWSSANRMEKDFSDNPGKYLGVKIND